MVDAAEAPRSHNRTGEFMNQQLHVSSTTDPIHPNRNKNICKHVLYRSE